MEMHGNASPPGVDFAWKVIIAGSGGVGKSTLIHRFMYNQFKEDMTMTIGCSHHSQYLERQSRNINLILWDLGGQKRFDVIHPAYVGGAVAGYAIFDMTDISTLMEIDRWVDLIRKYNSQETPVMLVGTKFDLIRDQQQLDDVYRLANEKVALFDLNAFLVTSSKLDINVKETIHYIVDYLLWKYACE